MLTSEWHSAYPGETSSCTNFALAQDYTDHFGQDTVDKMLYCFYVHYCLVLVASEEEAVLILTWSLSMNEVIDLRRSVFAMVALFMCFYFVRTRESGYFILKGV